MRVSTPPLSAALRRRPSPELVWIDAVWAGFSGRRCAIWYEFSANDTLIAWIWIARFAHPQLDRRHLTEGNKAVGPLPNWPN